MGSRSWLIAAVAALLGWLLATLLLAVGARPLDWVLLAAVAVTLVAVAAYARIRALRPSELAAYSFACIMLSWPVLSILTLAILTWVGVAEWE